MRVLFLTYLDPPVPCETMGKRLHHITQSVANVRASSHVIFVFYRSSRKVDIRAEDGLGGPHAGPDHVTVKMGWY